MPGAWPIGSAGQLAVHGAGDGVSVPNLGTLGGDRQAQDAMALEGLLAHALLCECGEQFREEGVAVFGVFKGRIPTDAGARDGAVVVMRHYHSKLCPLYLDALAHGIEWEGSEQAALTRPKVLAVRLLPAVTWLA